MGIMKDLPTRPRKAEVKAQMDPLPEGPYIYVHQLDNTMFRSHYKTMTHKLTKEFQLRFGYAIYTIDLGTSEPVLVAYWFDTSD